jgi:hypothetical protein
MTPSELKCVRNLHGTLKARCYNPNSAGYKYYGAQGVTVSNEFLHRPKFVDWAKESGYEEGMTLVRIDRSGPYSRGNCRWEMVPNRSNTYVEYLGEQYALWDACEETGVSERKFWAMLETGCTTQYAFDTLLAKRNKRSDYYGCKHL